jgi:hypothetical protein
MGSRVLAVLLLLLLPLGFGAGASAQSATKNATGLAQSDQDAIREVIEAQLAAFQRDDGATAFGFASPGIREKFGDAATFMAMVKSGYAAVYRPKSVAFDRLVDTGMGPDQMLRVIGPDGVAYTTHYIMQRQPDGRWMISACYLDRRSDKSV